MDVILLEDMKGLGAKGAMVHVKPGYARNYLLPRRLAIQAGRKLLVSERAIVTPAARDLGDANRVFSIAPWRG